jgi:hypothetical protein
MCALFSPVFACDEAFLQEPMYTEPDEQREDTVAGLVYHTYKFIDGRTLVTIRQMLYVSTEDEVVVLPNPLFYIVTDANYKSTTYWDPVGDGHCYEIGRY